MNQWFLADLAELSLLDDHQEPWSVFATCSYGANSVLWNIVIHGQVTCQYQGVLNAPIRTLRQGRKHWMRGVPQQRCDATTPGLSGGRRLVGATRKMRLP